MLFSISVNYASNTFKEVLISEKEKQLLAIAASTALHLESYAKDKSKELVIAGMSLNAKNVLLSFGEAYEALNNVTTSRKKYLRGRYVEGERSGDLNINTSVNNVFHRSMYKTVHDIHHPYFNGLQEQRNYKNIFLIDTDGNIIYSLMKEAYFGVNILDKKYTGRSLSLAYERTINLEREEVIFVDFKADPQDNDVISAFLATPIYDDDYILGILAVELSTTRIDSIVSPDGSYNLMGLGGTGEINLIGKDLFFRSSVKAYEGDSVGRLKTTSPSIIKALNGESGFMPSKDYREIDVYSAYVPVEVFEEKWALIVKVDSAELISQVQEIITILFIFNLLITVTLLLIYTYLLYGTLLTPLQLKYSELQHLTNVRNSDLSLSESISDEYKKSLDLVAAVSKLNTRGIITHVNYNFCELAGYSEDELIGKSHLILRNHDASRELDEHISNMVHSKRIWNGEIKYVTKNKQVSTIEIAIVPILACNGNIKEFMAIAYKL